MPEVTHGALVKGQEKRKKMSSLWWKKNRMLSGTMFTSTHWLMKSESCDFLIRACHGFTTHVAISSLFLQKERRAASLNSKSRFAFKLNRACCHVKLTSRASDVRSAKYRSFAYLVQEHFVQLLFGQGEAFAVSAVHDQDDDLERKVNKKKGATGSEFNHLLACEQRTTDPVLSVTTDKMEHVSVNSINDYATVILSTQVAGWNSKKSIWVNVCWLINPWNTFCCNSKNLLQFYLLIFLRNGVKGPIFSLHN